MIGNRRFIQAVGVSAFLLLGMAETFSFIEMKSQFFFFLVIWGLLTFSVLGKHYIDTNKLLTGVMYLLVMTTFLNQSVLSIHIGFFSLFLYRLVLILAVIIFFACYRKEKNPFQYWNQVNVKRVLIFLLLWLAYGFISLLWAKSLMDGFKYMVLMGTGVLFVFLAVFSFKTFARLIWFYGIWMFMTFILLVIGLMNHFAHIQLPSSTLYGGPEYKLSYPTAVFFNQNDFATFLSISFFFYFFAAKNSRSVWLKTFALLLALLSVYMIYLTESRASLLGIMVGIIVYLFMLLPASIKKVTVIICSVTAVVCSVVFFNKFTVLIGSFFNPGNQVSSNIVRLNLLKNAFHFVLETFGFGVGAGNIPFYLKNEAIYETNHVVEVHNWLAEIMGNFGIFVFLGYLTAYIYLFYSLYRAYKTKENWKQKGVIEACMMGLISFLVSSISPSSVSNLYFHWVFLGFVISTVNVCKNNKNQVHAEINAKEQGLKWNS
jgi:teichuronic acid biosynthesis protein TuaE